jgi:hypothetical protein
MSIKKAVSFSFLLLASMILLAHSLIPHHHHNQIPVALNIANHEHGSDATHDHHHHDDAAPAEHNDNSHGHEVIEDCLLEKAFVRIGSDRQAFQTLDFNFDLLPCLLPLFSGYSISQITDNGLPFRQKPYLQSFHTDYISQSLGLRAPPVC